MQLEWKLFLRLILRKTLRSQPLASSFISPLTRLSTNQTTCLSNSNTYDTNITLSYHNNVYGTIILVNAMKKFNVKRLIFSSSAVVYGIPSAKDRSFIGEEVAAMSLTNPYGRTKKMCEEILQDVCTSELGWKVILLRYFNPVGAHPDAIVGEDPVGIPNNLMPYVARVAVSNLIDFSGTEILSTRLEELKQMTHLNVFGSDYDTKDGSGVRDFIHVMDLAKGHLLSLEAVVRPIANNGPWWTSDKKHASDTSICRVYNLGIDIFEAT